MTQLEKIKELCFEKEWVCQLQFWQISKSPHKRRNDIIKEGRFKFESRPCVHGHRLVRDYMMVENETYKPEVRQKPLVDLRLVDGELRAFILSNGQS